MFTSFRKISPIFGFSHKDVSNLRYPKLKCLLNAIPYFSVPTEMKCRYEFKVQ